MSEGEAAGDEPTPSMSVDEAIREILEFGAPRAGVRVHRRLNLGGKPLEREAAVLGREHVQMDVDTALALLRKLSHIAGIDPKDGASIEEAAVGAIHRRWAEAEERVVAFCLEELAALRSNVARFGAVLARSRLLSSGLIDVLEASSGRSPSWLLVPLQFDLSDLRRLVELRRQERLEGFDDELAGILDRSTAPRLWGAMVAASLRIWTDPSVAAVFHALSLLPVTGYHPDFDLTFASPDTRQGWRDAVVEAVQAVPGAFPVLLEMILWLGEDYADTLVMPLAAALCGAESDGGETALAALARHPSVRVTVRVAALRDLFRKERVDMERPPEDNLLGASATAIPLRRPGVGAPLTWLGNREVEELIEEAVEKVAARFAGTYEGHWREDEEPLATRVLERLSVALGAVEEQVEVIGREQGATTRLGFTLTERIVPKVEEGQDGLVAGSAFAADICLVLTARRNGLAFAARATLIQAKKLRMKTGRQWEPSYSVDMKQLGDLAGATASSHYLFMGPGESGRFLPVVPARLLKDLLRPGALTRSFNRADLGRVSRGLGRWLTYDVIGLWTGDPDVKAVKKAAGEDGRSTYRLVELTVDLSERSDRR